MSGRAGTTPHRTAPTVGLNARLHRIGGQIKGIERMIADDRDSAEVLTQMAAAEAAPHATAGQVLDRAVGRLLAEVATGRLPPAEAALRIGVLTGLVADNHHS